MVPLPDADVGADQRGGGRKPIPQRDFFLVDADLPAGWGGSLFRHGMKSVCTVLGSVSSHQREGMNGLMGKHAPARGSHSRLLSREGELLVSRDLGHRAAVTAMAVQSPPPTSCRLHVPPSPATTLCAAGEAS